MITPQGRITTASEPLDGFATCLARGCASYGEHKPIGLVRERTTFYIPGSPLVDRDTVNLRPADDGDIACPECGSPRGIAETLPPVLQPIMPPTEQ